MKTATAIAEEIHDATTVAQTRRKQGESLHALGRTSEAEEAFKDGIARLDSMGETARSGDGKLRLAHLYLDLGRLGEAEAMARAAVEQHERAQVDSCEAGAVLARVLVAAGKAPRRKRSPPPRWLAPLTSWRGRSPPLTWSSGRSTRGWQSHA